MAHKKITGVRQIATGTGTGDLTLGAVVSAAYRTVQDAGMGDDDTAYFMIRNSSLPNEWEIVFLTYNSSGTTISRAFDSKSISSTGSLIDFSAGNKIVSEARHDGVDWIIETSSDRPANVPSLAALKAFPDTEQNVFTVSRTTPGDNGGGLWVFDTGDQSTNVSADAESGLWAAPDADPTGATGAWRRIYDGAINARWFGVTLDGATDDTDALQAFFAAVDFFGGSGIIPAGVSEFENVSLTLTQDLHIECQATLRNGLGASATDSLILLDGDSKAHSVFWSGGRFDGNTGSRTLLFVADCDKAQISIDESFSLTGTTTSPGSMSNVVVNGCNDVMLKPGHIHDTEEGTSTLGSVPRCVSLSNNVDATVIGGFFKDVWGCFVLAGNENVTINGTVMRDAGDNGVYIVETGTDLFDDGTVTMVGVVSKGVNEPVVPAFGGKLIVLGGILDFPNAIGLQNTGALELDGVRIIARGGAGNVVKTRVDNTASGTFRMRNCYVEAEVANSAFEFLVGALDIVELENNHIKWFHNSDYTPSANIFRWTSGTRFEINNNLWEFYDESADIANGNWNLIPPTVTELSSFRGNRLVNRTGNASAVFRANAFRQQLVTFDGLMSLSSSQSETTVHSADATTAEPRVVWGGAAPTSGDWQAGSRVINVAPTFNVMGWLCVEAGAPGIWVAFGGSWRTIATSAVAVARNSANDANDAVELTVVSVSVPANSIGANGIVVAEATWSYSRSTNAKTVRIRFGGTQFRADNLTLNTQTIRTAASIQNVNATNSQKGAADLVAPAIGYGSYDAAIETGTVDTTANQTVTFTAVWAGATSSENITLERYRVEVLYVM